MSTFPGLIQEIPGISIDCFEGENMNSSAFFLSHCHQDHMKGLNENFFTYIVQKNCFFYCSNISKLFIENSFYNFDKYLANAYIIELPLDEQRIVDYVHNDIHILLKVSCISSGHCPGSVMFLFDYDDKRILYTGDFRINKKNFSKLKSLHYNNIIKTPLDIDKIYLDTTFLSLDFKMFPSRKDSLKKLSTAVKEWIQKEPKNIVILETSALYGSEFIYIELSRILNTKIHVKESVFNIYRRIEILLNSVTNVSESTQIHACINKRDNCKKSQRLKCRPDIDQKYVLTIVPSAQKWAGKDTSCISEFDNIRKQTINICYSTHASYDELEAFIFYFKPKDIIACVNHNSKEIQDLLRRMMEKIENDKCPIEISNTSFSKYRNFVNNCKFKSKLLCDVEEDF